MTWYWILAIVLSSLIIGGYIAVKLIARSVGNVGHGLFRRRGK